MQTIRNKKLGLEIQLDEKEIFPDDPGQGTPAMVTYINEEKEILAGTWNCVTSEGEIEGYPLNQEQLNWLNSKESEVNKWMRDHNV